MDDGCGYFVLNSSGKVRQFSNQKKYLDYLLGYSNMVKIR